MKDKVHGYQPNQNSVSALPMNFEQAKAAATARRAEQFEQNRQRFHGCDGWDQGEYKQSTNNFWGWTTGKLFNLCIDYRNWKCPGNVMIMEKVVAFRQTHYDRGL